MKKFVTVLMVVALAVSCMACGKKADPVPTEPSKVPVVEEAAPTEPVKAPSAMAALPSDATFAQTIIADFTDKANSGDYATAESLAMAITEAAYIPFGAATMPVEPGYLNGFTADVTGFKEGCFFGPFIGSIPFAGYVFVLEDGANTEDFINNLKSLADLRWNICTQADEMLAESVGNMVCFVMSPTSFED